MTTTTARKPVAPKVATPDSVTLALTALNAYSDVIGNLRGSSIGAELDAMRPMSEALVPWFTAVSAAYGTAHEGKEMPVGDFYKHMVITTEGKFKRAVITERVVRDAVKVFPLHTSDTLVVFQNISANAADQRFADQEAGLKGDAVTKSVPLTIAAYLVHLPRIAAGEYDSDGNVTAVGEANEAARQLKVSETQTKRLSKRASEGVKSGAANDLAIAVKNQADANGESRLVAARRIAFDALTLVAQAERDATAEELAAADAIITL